MKYVKTFEEWKVYEEFLLESNFNIMAWHTSFKELKKFDEIPAWFTNNGDFAKTYHKNSEDKGGDLHTYEVKITGKILNQDEARELSDELGIDFDDLTTSLSENPTPNERKKLIKPFIGKCDGFFHWDYDPRDWGDGESILVFNPGEHAKIIKSVNF